MSVLRTQFPVDSRASPEVCTNLSSMNTGFHMQSNQSLLVGGYKPWCDAKVNITTAMPCGRHISGHGSSQFTLKALELSFVPIFNVSIGLAARRMYITVIYVKTPRRSIRWKEETINESPHHHPTLLFSSHPTYHSLEHVSRIGKSFSLTFDPFDYSG